jgi:hypothetical protein
MNIYNCLRKVSLRAGFSFSVLLVDKERTEIQTSSSHGQSELIRPTLHLTVDLAEDASSWLSLIVFKGTPFLSL